MKHLMKESIKLTKLPVFLFFLFNFVPHTLPAQDWAARLFKTGKYARYKCVNMGAYNKHRKGRLKKEAKFRSTQPLEPGKITQAAPRGPVSVRPPKTEPPARVTETPAPVPPIATLPPATKSADPPPVAKSEQPRKVPFREMTQEQRRQLLLKSQPEIELPPIRFITAQDEFSVVNMDSFMQAMEYAQQGKIVLIEGHTDDVGTEDSNLKLSMKRAEKIRELMLSGGVSDDVISVIGFGEAQPIVPNNSTQNRAVNRRIEFKVFSLPE
jgi:outer membrane protein OmpA-like peptidoglycan-associated protein